MPPASTVASIESSEERAVRLQIGSSASVSEIAAVSMNRSNGISKREQRTRDGDGGRHPARPRQPAVDPDEQRDQEERRHDERVPLLDPVRELRGECGDYEKQ